MNSPVTHSIDQSTAKDAEEYKWITDLILHKLRKIKDPRRATIIQRNILHAVFNAEIEELTEAAENDHEETDDETENQSFQQQPNMAQGAFVATEQHREEGTPQLSSEEGTPAPMNRESGAAFRTRKRVCRHLQARRVEPYQAMTVMNNPPFSLYANHEGIYSQFQTIAEHMPPHIQAGMAGGVPSQVQTIVEYIPPQHHSYMENMPPQNVPSVGCIHHQQLNSGESTSAESLENSGISLSHYRDKNALYNARQIVNCQMARRNELISQARALLETKQSLIQAHVIEGPPQLQASIGLGPEQQVVGLGPETEETKHSPSSISACDNDSSDQLPSGSVAQITRVVTHPQGAPTECISLLDDPYGSENDTAEYDSGENSSGSDEKKESCKEPNNEEENGSGNNAREN